MESMKALEAKVAIVTGGTRGIGRAIAEALLKEGASVAICGRSRENLDAATKELSESYPDRVAGEVCDVSNWEDVRNLFRTVDSRFGRLDILVNNAGIGKFSAVADLSPQEWNAVIGTNLNGVFYCSKLGIERFKRVGGGYIVNISSLAAKNAFAGGGVYNASKFALTGLSEATMLDHRYDNIRVSYIMPGSVDSEFSPRSGAANWKIAPEDIADIVLMLLRMPARTLVSRVEVRPSKPQK
jgi:NAD(P)-dependent dehydrogenase (short-subunit alcohol dehydrogenase family)